MPPALKNILLNHEFSTCADGILTLTMKAPFKKKGLNDFSKEIVDSCFTENLPCKSNLKPADDAKGIRKRKTQKSSQQSKNQEESEADRAKGTSDNTPQVYHWKVDGSSVSSTDPRVTRLQGHLGTAYMFYRLSDERGGTPYSHKLISENADHIARARVGANGIVFYGNKPPPWLPRGAVARVKVVGKCGDIGLAVYRADNQGNQGQPLLYYTDRRLTSGIH